MHTATVNAIPNTTQKSSLLELLSRHFGYTMFRQNQQDIIESILAGKNTAVIMPTGAGKSLCYQLPAMILPHLTVVVSPLISLMKDQVDSLNARGNRSTFINSSLSYAEQTARLDATRSGSFKLLYVAPERFGNQEFLASLKTIPLSLFVIDEAHCISEWGHDFRPSYLRIKDAIGELKTAGQSFPVSALTATATPEVKRDIIKQLALETPRIFVSGFRRDNLRLEVKRTSAFQKIDYLLPALRSAQADGSAIIYAGTRKKVEETVMVLREYGIPSDGYHAGMENEERKKVQEDFLTGKTKVMVATNAFGMGIDKPDIRLVIHHDMPGTLENYYQEIGRAGRDGKPSRCILLSSAGDRYLREFFLAGENPSPQTIKEVYHFLIREHSRHNHAATGESTLYVTGTDIAGSVSDEINEMAISTALKILEKEGYIERLSEKDNPASATLLRQPEEILAAVGNRAKKQIEAIRIFVSSYGAAKSREIRFSLDDVASLMNVKKNSVQAALNAMKKNHLIAYEPPFRGRGIKMLKTSGLNMNFEALEEKRKRDYGKLDLMEAYAHHSGCRHAYILEYFDEKNILRSCGSCDNCLMKSL